MGASLVPGTGTGTILPHVPKGFLFSLIDANLVPVQFCHMYPVDLCDV